MASGAWKDSPLNIKNMGWTKEEEQNMVVDLKSEAIGNLKNVSVKIKRLKIGLPKNSTLGKSQFSRPKVSRAYQAICVSLFVQSLTYLGHSIDIRVKTVAWQYFDVCSHVNPDAFFRLRGKVLLHFDLY